MVQSLSSDFGLSIRWSSVRGLGRKFARHGHQIFIDWVRVVNFIFHFFKNLQYALFNLKVSLRMHSALAYAGYEDAFEIFILPTLDQHGKHRKRTYVPDMLCILVEDTLFWQRSAENPMAQFNLDCIVLGSRELVRPSPESQVQVQGRAGGCARTPAFPCERS